MTAVGSQPVNRTIENRVLVRARWQTWALGEGVCRGCSLSLLRLIANFTSSLGGALIAQCAIDAIRFFTCLVISLAKRQPLVIHWKYALFSLLFGLNSVVITTLVILTMAKPGVDVSVAASLRLSGMALGPILDRIFFGDRIFSRYWLGLLLFYVSAWSFLGFPHLSKLVPMQSWIWLSILTGVLLAANELFSRLVGQLIIPNWSKPSVFQNGAWAGFGGTFFAALAVTTLADWSAHREFSTTAWTVVGLTGISNTALIIAKFLSYSLPGSTITVKKCLTYSTELVLLIFSGIAFFHESFVVGKLVGVPLVVGAYLLLTRKPPTIQRVGETT